MQRSRRFLRLVSLALLQSFICQQISFAEVVAPAKQDPFEKPKVDLHIPASVGTIEDAYKNGSGKTDRKSTRLNSSH